MLGNNAWRIGRVGGIEIKIDPSWSFIAFLIAYSFFVQLSFEFPEQTTTTLIVPALLMAVVFFGSVLIHELAHSFVARSRGVEVKGITLFLFGGATHADLETENPTDELVISIVGPLTSLALGAVLWGIAEVTSPGMVGYAAGYLGWINLALAVFNLVPGFPLDGGRVLRSLIWRASGDLVKATRIAARAGQLVGYALIGFGIFLVLFAGNLVGGLWLVAIGWFLSQSAQSSFMQMQVRRMLSDVPAAQMMTRDLMELSGDLTLRQAVDDYFMRHDFNAFPVSEDGRVVGIITLSTVRQVPRDEWATRRVREFVTPLSDACTVDRSEPMDEVLDKLSSNEHHRVVVKEDGEVAGIITPRDLARWLERSQDLGLTESLRRSS
ncbi:MAG TPA: site-2 protease family protein [Acidimicrobiia bacterium]|nr:site-2 protease family protein [Acidimicrobiia bacterium]